MTKKAALSADLYQWTVSKYHELIKAGIFTEDDKIELLNGQIVPMSPIGKLHAACVDKICSFFYRLRREDIQVRCQNPISTDDLSEPEPDITLLKFREDFYATNHPGKQDILLLIEVADSSLDKDKKIKLPIYAASGIEECWLVDLSNECIERHTLPSPDGYKRVEFFRRADEIQNPVVGKIPVGKILL